jgi:hypothetical protein
MGELAVFFYPLYSTTIAKLQEIITLFLKFLLALLLRSMQDSLW